MKLEEFNEYIKSIGGLKDGNRYSSDEPIYNVGYVNDGWLPLLKELIEDLIELGWDRRICAIKEKFGGLRFYIGYGTKEINYRIIKAEQDSYTICESCGESGELRKSGWWKTLCEICNEKGVNHE